MRPMGQPDRHGLNHAYRAAKLAAVPAGGRPAGETCPVVAVVIPGGGKGDRPVGSPGVKVSVGRAVKPGQIRQRRRATRQAVARANRLSPEMDNPTRSGLWVVGSAEPVIGGRRLCRRRRNRAQAADGLPGVVEDGMSRRNGQRKLGTTRGSPRRSRTAKAARISREGEVGLCLRVGRMGPIK